MSKLIEQCARDLTSAFPDEVHAWSASGIVATVLRTLKEHGPSEGMIEAGESAASVGIGKPVDEEALPRVWRAMLTAAIEEADHADD